MLTRLLSSVAEGGKILIDEEDYLLARIKIHDKVMLAEVSRGSTGGLPPGECPDIEGVILPDSEIHPSDDSDAKILLFSVPDNAILLMEQIMRNGGVSETEAVSTGMKVLEILRKIHDEGHRIGYLGPENVMITDNGEYFILGGARGIPDTPFSPPEAVGKNPDDPRSDVFALGLLIFRILAGSDNRDVQINAWNMLSRKMLALLENMVSPEVNERFPNLTILSNELRNLRSDLQVDLLDEHRENRKRILHKKAFWIPVVLVAAVIICLLIFGVPGDIKSVPDDVIPVDSTALMLETSLLPDSDLVEIPVENVISTQERDPILWITNGAGRPGLASDFREGPASEMSGVYTCTGSPRRSSILLLRRSDPRIPISQQGRNYELASELASSNPALVIKPIDINILLGNDLVNDVLPTGVTISPIAPAGTLFVDIANHGVEGVFDGAGAATWTRSVLNGRSILIDGEEWFIEVIDFRNGDMLNAELGIESELDSTLFFYNRDIPVCRSAEAIIRYMILEDSTVNELSEYSFPIPDIWVLLGSE
ncbi:MAG: hypothetical protein KAQ97_03410 [Candidatus Fermentibacteraceae bacterium]|nr:hypothetical protein [Candidatus Fermentibacteraceae bacterium]